MFNDHPHILRRRELRRKQTEAEMRLWHFLRGRRLGGYKFFRQYGVGPYILDFYCPTKRLAVEADGSQHGLPEGEAHDRNRTEALLILNIKVIRFWNNDILARTDVVLQIILDEL